MKEVHKKVWRLAMPYLSKGEAKDYVAHTKGVVKSMEFLLKHEKGDGDILIPAAILHDVGWSKVPPKLQRSSRRQDRIKALRLHIKYAPPIIERILEEAGYDKEKIRKVIMIVASHKFSSPRSLDKRLLIDADAMSDALKGQFYSDVKSYGKSPLENYEFRKGNRFYTRSAEIFFRKELEKRKAEISRMKR
jgi:HD superfamily phosphodiesterase